jgi:hypothetical protein
VGPSADLTCCRREKYLSLPRIEPRILQSAAYRYAVTATHILEFGPTNKGGRRTVSLTPGLFITDMVAAHEREISFVAPKRLNNLHTVKNRIYPQIGPGVNTLTCIQDLSFRNLDWYKDYFGRTVVLLNPS